uniref:Retrotransposon protein, putative, unclassified n=1 Tax=Oryza sativa subsp. japonica TaxID=39947 RepID=Q10JX9_ORYSJ|nr:retrotransposon protein, putative, unclassified [Oryza sativa Japonica Group]
MERELGGTEPEPVLGRMVAVEDYILYGFLPPPSEFFLLVLNFYGLSLLHLNPNSIAFLSIFSHLCEAYIGVEPFLDLFRFYYELLWMEPKKVSGKWRARWFYLQIEDSDPVFVVPEEQPDKIPSWTAKPALTLSLQSFIDIIDDLRERGLSGYEVTADFIGVNSTTVERRVGQVIVSSPTTASNVPVPLCEKGVAERKATINALPLPDVIGPLVDHQAAASLKEGVAQEASNVAIAAAATTTSGGNVPRKGRKFSSVLGNRRKTPTPSSEDVILTLYSVYLGLGCVSPASATAEAGDTWREGGAGEGGARWVRRELQRVSCGGLDRCRGCAQVREDLQKMRELVAGNERQRQGLENRMLELENNLSEIRGSLRVTYTGLHQLDGECGVTTTIPANSDEFSLTTSLAELATAMKAIPSKHTARIGEETSNRIYTGVCHVLACIRLAHPELDLQRILDQGAANDARKDMMEEVGDLGESVLPLFEEDVDVKDVQQRGQPELPVLVLALALEPYVPQDGVDQNLPVDTGMATTSLDLENALADRDRHIQYWRTKFEVAELETTMLEVKKDRAVEALRGREVWFNSYLRSCCTAMAGVCKELRVPRGDPEESAAGYISWLNGACAQLEGIGSDKALSALGVPSRSSLRFLGGLVKTA